MSLLNPELTSTPIPVPMPELKPVPMPKLKPVPVPSHLRVAIFACGPVEGKMETELGYTAGVEGTREIFHKFLTENPKIPDPLNPGQKILNPALAVIANNLESVVFDVLGGEPVSNDVPIFYDADPRFPSQDALDTFDAIFVSGSGTSVRYVRNPKRKAEWEGKIRRLQRYLRWVIDNRPAIKLFGICFGHQILSFASGHAVDRNPRGWEVGPTDIALNQFGKKIFRKGALIMEELHQDHVLLNTVPGGMNDSGSGGYGYNTGSGGIGHKKDSEGREQPKPSSEVVIDTSVKRVDGLNRWGESELTYNQGMIKIPDDALKDLDLPHLYLRALEKIHIFTSQGHPELDRDMIRVLIEDYKEPEVKGGIPEDRAQAALERNKDTSFEISTDEIAIVWWQMLRGAYQAKNINFPLPE